MTRWFVVLAMVMLISCGDQESARFLDTYEQQVENLKAEYEKALSPEEYAAFKKKARPVFWDMQEIYHPGLGDESIRLYADLAYLIEEYKSAGDAYAELAESRQGAVRDTLLIRAASAYTFAGEDEPARDYLKKSFDYDQLAADKDYLSKILAERLYHEKGLPEAIKLLTLAQQRVEPSVRIDSRLSSFRLVGQRVPQIDSVAAWINTAPLSRSDFTGKITLMEFWATWCGTCRSAIPQLKDIEKAYSSFDGFQLITLSRIYGYYADEEERYQDLKPAQEVGHLRDFVKNAAIRYPVIIAADEYVFEKFAISSIPTFYLVDQQAKIRHVWFGADPDQFAHMKARIDELMHAAETSVP